MYIDCMYQVYLWALIDTSLTELSNNNRSREISLSGNNIVGLFEVMHFRILIHKYISRFSCSILILFAFRYDNIVFFEDKEKSVSFL
jgi:hypothetical protein